VGAQCNFRVQSILQSQLILPGLGGEWKGGELALPIVTLRFQSACQVQQARVTGAIVEPVNAFEIVAAANLRPIADEKILLDARYTRFAGPYGLTAMLAIAQARSERSALYAPESDDTASYWARTVRRAPRCRVGSAASTGWSAICATGACCASPTTR